MTELAERHAAPRLAEVAPFNRLSDDVLGRLLEEVRTVRVEAGEFVFEEGKPLPGLYVIDRGAVDIWAGSHSIVSHRGPGEIMGERGLLRGGKAVLSARATEPTDLFLIPAARFHYLSTKEPEFQEWFAHARPAEAERDESAYAIGLMAVQVADLMATSPVSCPPLADVRSVAELMRDRSISSVLVMEGDDLRGIVTVHDLVNKVLAEGLGGTAMVNSIMTPNPVTISPDAVGLDALLEMAERRINHLPVADRQGRIVGMIGRTDLFRNQATTASHMAAEIVSANDSSAMAKVMERLPDLVKSLSQAGIRPAATCRRITDLTDAITRRLISLAEAELGPAPVPYLWAACGSQGRREQTGVSDQDNCLILDDGFRPEHDAYFAKLATFVSDGLNKVGFVYCPGDMMATNPRWRQPRETWRRYFAGWIAEPDGEAQMLASVMFDLRPIAGDRDLFLGLQDEVLGMARKNSIFVRHMVENSLKHTPPLSLFRGFSVFRSGAHKNTVDLKHAGVVPVVDLGRVYALKGGIAEVNTLERIAAAGEAGVISKTGARDLTDAYELIAETRLAHQAEQIAKGQAPDNYLAPGQLSELDRNHLRDAFLVVKTMQSSLASLS